MGDLLFRSKRSWRYTRARGHDRTGREDHRGCPGLDWKAPVRRSAFESPPSQTIGGNGSRVGQERFRIEPIFIEPSLRLIRLSGDRLMYLRRSAASSSGA